MKLIGSYTSPYVRKVHVMLIEKALPFELVIDPPWEATTHVPDINPLGKVPALVADDGEVFADSNVIAEYLENLHVAPAFLPADPMARLRVRNLTMLADGITDAGVALMLERKRPPEIQQAGWMERQRGKIERGLDALERHASHGECLHPDGFGLADVAIACCVAWLDFRMPDLAWQAKRPALAAQVMRTLARPSFVATVPKG